jgi:hypothetical protein
MSSKSITKANGTANSSETGQVALIAALNSLAVAIQQSLVAKLLR